MTPPDSQKPPANNISQVVTASPAQSASAHPTTPQTSPGSSTLLATQISRGLRLRCPVCGQGKLFRGWFTMYETCPHCHFRYERSPGFWLGSIYANYGLTALIVTGAFFALFFSEALPEEWIKGVLLAFTLLFPLWFFRYARGIWLAIDVYFDPVPAAENPVALQEKQASTSA
jgi:uncharacterized protein (DUF983 family)